MSESARAGSVASTAAFLPACVEIKRRLDGSEQRFACQMVALEPSRAILRYRIDRVWEVAGIRLWPGCLTYAIYWTDRPYNVYWWVDPAGRSLGFYFNVADLVRLTPEVVEWRDLSLDVLVRPDGGAEVLDEAELPADLPPPMRVRLEEALGSIMAAPAALIAEVQATVARHLER